MKEYKRIVIKIGSNVLTLEDGTIAKKRMTSIAAQVAKLHNRGIEVVLVSSGAVASGRSEVTPSHKLDDVSARQLYSAVGQSKLINRYFKLFSDHDIVVGQVLTTKENFSSRRHYLNMKNCMGVMLSNGVIPIVNENDTISITELMFTDNDELSGLMATMMDAEALMILSNIDGIFDGSPDNPSSKVIREIGGDNTDLSNFIQPSKSSFGRGGMLTKCRIAQKVASEGIEVIIANGTKEDIITDIILDRDKDTVCTRFKPEKRVSGVKKWIAHSDSFAKGEIYINKGAEDSLYGCMAVSLLPIGITNIKGEFSKDDIVAIFNAENRQIGVGKASYDSKKAVEYMGQRGKRAFIHYDYLHVYGEK